MASGQKTEMITIDGSEGEGGGQILRTSLALSLVTGQPFRMERIRAKRQKPGLLRQHLTAVEAAVHSHSDYTSVAHASWRTLADIPVKRRPALIQVW
jgi:RNA 3'-terminal phosphate cyclase (ATP)